MGFAKRAMLTPASITLPPPPSGLSSTISLDDRGLFESPKIASDVARSLIMMLNSRGRKNVAIGACREIYFERMELSYVMFLLASAVGAFEQKAVWRPYVCVIHEKGAGSALLHSAK